MNIQEIHRVVDLITYKPNAGFFISTNEDDMWIQHFQRIPCTVFRKLQGEEPLQKGRKWRISKYASQSEVVQTCLLAVIQFEEYEARENFKVAGHACYGPHLDVNALIEISDKKDARNEDRNHRQQEPRHRAGLQGQPDRPCPTPTAVDDQSTG